jgi:RNA polymerase sigma factor (sigma-70 family)
LVARVPAAERIKKQDRQDLVQVVLLKLQDKALCQRLATEIDTPAHYLAKVMENFLQDEITEDAKLGRVFKHYAKVCEATEDERPDAQAARNELRANVRFIVDHVLDRRDRIALGGLLKGRSIGLIARELGCTKAQASLILFRAKEKFAKQFRKHYGR